MRWETMSRALWGLVSSLVIIIIAVSLTPHGSANSQREKQSRDGRPQIQAGDGPTIRPGAQPATAAFRADGQQPDAQGRRAAITIRLDTDLVVIDVTATDKSGNYIRDLRAEEIQVLEDGQPRDINFF